MLVAMIAPGFSRNNTGSGLRFPFGNKGDIVRRISKIQMMERPWQGQIWRWIGAEA